MANRLNLRMVPLVLHDRARDTFAQRDALGFLCTASNTEALRFVFDNLVALRAAGMYAPALLEALTGGQRLTGGLGLTYRDRKSVV